MSRLNPLLNLCNDGTAALNKLSSQIESFQASIVFGAFDFVQHDPNLLGEYLFSLTHGQGRDVANRMLNVSTPVGPEAYALMRMVFTDFPDISAFSAAEFANGQDALWLYKQGDDRLLVGWWPLREKESGIAYLWLNKHLAVVNTFMPLKIGWKFVDVSQWAQGFDLKATARQLVERYWIGFWYCRPVQWDLRDVERFLVEDDILKVEQGDHLVFFDCVGYLFDDEEVVIRKFQFSRPDQWVMCGFDREGVMAFVPLDNPRMAIVSRTPRQIDSWEFAILKQNKN